MTGQVGCRTRLAAAPLACELASQGAPYPTAGPPGSGAARRTYSSQLRTSLTRRVYAVRSASAKCVVLVVPGRQHILDPSDCPRSTVSWRPGCFAVRVRVAGNL